jgi:hypothetical protein
MTSLGDYGIRWATSGPDDSLLHMPMAGRADCHGQYVFLLRASVVIVEELI